MSQEITPLQTLILWALLARGGGEYQKDLKPEPSKANREALVGAGLISCNEKSRPFLLQVEDKGWHWASQNMGAEISTQSNAGSVVLQHLLPRLGAYMKARDIALAELLAPQEQAPPAEVAREPTSQPHRPKSAIVDTIDFAALREKIRAAFLDLTGGKFNTRVRLCDLRAKLRDLDRATLDEALLAIASEEGTVLMQLDNRVEITDSDREAVLRIGAEPRHLLWISK
jgi:hypothetical protein